MLELQEVSGRQACPEECTHKPDSNSRPGGRLTAIECGEMVRGVKRKTVGSLAW